MNMTTAGVCFSTCSPTTVATCHPDGGAVAMSGSCPPVGALPLSGSASLAGCCVADVTDDGGANPRTEAACFYGLSIDAGPGLCSGTLQGRTWQTTAP